MSAVSLEPLHPITPPKPGRWLTWAMRINLFAVSLWGLWVLLTPPSFSSVGYLFKVLLPLWAVLACFSLYHLIYTPALRVRALLYALAPIGIFIFANGIYQIVDVPVGGGRYGAVLSGAFCLAVIGVWVTLALRRVMRRRNWSFPKLTFLDHGLNGTLAVLVVFWVSVTLTFGNEAAFSRMAREQETLLVLIAYAWLTSVGLCFVALGRGSFGLLAPAGRGRRLTFALQLVLTGLLALAMAIPSVLFIAVFAVGG